MQRIHTNNGWVDYEGPGWYRDGIRISTVKASSPADAAWVDLEHIDHIHRMLDEGCPHHTDPIETIYPQAVRSNTLSVYITNKFNLVRNWFKNLFHGV